MNLKQIWNKFCIQLLEPYSYLYVDTFQDKFLKTCEMRHFCFDKNEYLYAT